MNDDPLVVGGQQVATVSGAAGTPLRVTPMTIFNPLEFRAIVANSCGSAFAHGAVLHVTDCGPPPCDPDVNCDGSPDQGDVACMILAVAGDTSCICQDPDFNQDGSADQGDVAAIIGVVAGQPCP